MYDAYSNSIGLDLTFQIFIDLVSGTVVGSLIEAFQSGGEDLLLADS